MNTLNKISWISLVGMFLLAACCKSTTGFANSPSIESLTQSAAGSTTTGSTAVVSLGNLRTP